MPLGTFSKLPRESLRALYYRLGGTDDISNLRTRRALLKKIYEAMGNDSADLDNMHRAGSVLQKISEVASVGGNGGKYVEVDISDAQLLDPASDPSRTNPWILSSRATAEINAIMDAIMNADMDVSNAGKIPVFKYHNIYGFFGGFDGGAKGWEMVMSPVWTDITAYPFPDTMGCRSSDYTERAVDPSNPGGGTEA